MRFYAGTAAVAALLLLLASPAAARTGPVDLGTAVGGPDFMGNTDPRYRETMKLFDSLTAENDMKMYHQRPSRSVFDFAVRGRALARAVVNIPAGSRQTAVIPLGFTERQRLRRARTARLVVEAVATDPTGRRAQDRTTSG